jgi:type II secretory pathway pseudopilin PulG
MAALLVTIAVMAILMTVAMPAWRQEARREKEAELIFRAGQYVHAIELYKRKFANTYPPNIDVLIKGRFLRKKYTDPMTKDGEFRLLTPQELTGTPTRMLNGQLGNMPGTRGAGGRARIPGPTFGSAGSTDNRLGSGTALTGQGLGSAPGTSAGGFGTPSSGGTTGPGGETIQVGPIATVASKSTEQSIRIFKGRDHYNQWIVTIDDVIPRQFLRPPQTTQPGQQPGANPGRSPSPGRPSFGPTTPSSPIR